MFDLCPLCNSDDVRILSKIPYDSIRAIYQRQFSIKLPVENLKYLHYMKCSHCGMLFFHPSVVGDGALYEKLQQFPWYYLIDKSEFHVAAAHIKEGDNVLEVGCGEGNFFKHLPSNVCYTGIEYNDAAITKAKKKGLNVSKISLSELNQTSHQAFDVICTFQVLEHIPEPGRFMAQMLDVLKPGGLLILAVPSEDSFMRYELNNVLNLPPHHQNRWSDSTLRHISSLFNLELICIEHEKLSDQHIPAYAKSQFFRLVSSILGLRLLIISRWADWWPLRALIYLLTIPLRFYYKLILHPDVAGHTVTAVYKQPKM